jgi:hypothetical protein
LTDEQLQERASERPGDTTSREYQAWYRARRILGLPTSASGLTADLRAYQREYARQRRAKRRLLRKTHQNAK